jgi:hypothetical protein
MKFATSISLLLTVTSTTLAFTPTSNRITPYSITSLASSLAPEAPTRPIYDDDSDGNDDNDDNIIKSNGPQHTIQITTEKNIDLPFNTPDTTTTSILERNGPLSMSFEELSEALGGAGRARIVWDCYKLGIDPAHMFGSVINLGQDDYESIVNRLPSQRRTQKLGPDTLDKLQKLYQNSYGGKNPSVTNVEGGVASLSYISRASDSTTKLLLKLSDGLEVETVISPWNGKRSTLCISSQVGCRQGKPHKVSFFFCSNDDPSMKSHFWNIIILSLCISTCVIIIFNYWLQVALFVPPGEWEN